MHLNFKLLKKCFHKSVLSFATHCIVLINILYNTKHLCYANSSANKTFQSSSRSTTKNPFRVVTVPLNEDNTINPFQIIHTVPQEKVDTWMAELRSKGTGLLTYQQLKHYQEELHNRQIFDHVEASLKQLWEAELPNKTTPTPLNYTGNITEIKFSSDE